MDTLKSPALWAKLTPVDFEELVFWVLYKEGFHNVSWFGRSGSDKGRDIVCCRTEFFGPRLVDYKCVVQCKRYKDRLSRRTIYDEIVKCIEHEFDVFILATTGFIAASAKDWIAAAEKKFNIRIVLWERVDMAILLHRHQDLRSQFLGVPLSSKFVIDRIASEGSGLDRLERYPVDPVVKAALQNAATNALRREQRLTIAHVWHAMLNCGFQSFEHLEYVSGRRLNWTSVQGDLGDLIKLQPKIKSKRGFLLSNSARAAFESLVLLLERLGHDNISEKILLLALLVQKESASIGFLASTLGLSDKELVAELMFRFFREDVPSIKAFHDLCNQLRENTVMPDSGEFEEDLLSSTRSIAERDIRSIANAARGVPSDDL